MITIICALFISVCIGIIAILFKQKAQIKMVYQTEIENLKQQLIEEKARFEQNWKHHKSLIIKDLKTQFDKKEAALQHQVESLNQQLIEEKARFEQNWKHHKSLIIKDLKIQSDKKETALQNQVQSLNQQLIEEKARFEQNWEHHKSLIIKDLKTQFDKKEAALQHQVESLNQQLVQEKQRFEKEKMLRFQWRKIILDSNNITTFENLIHIATADGQLTLNEKTLLQKKAVELGVNYDDYLDKINELLQVNVKETNLIDKDKEKGNDFEKYIVQKFTKQYFKILEWAGDKYVEGRFAQTTLEPDLKLQFKYKNIQIDFAVECKYRSHFYKNGIEWASEKQLNSYQKFSFQKQQPVFIIIGVGGVANAPDELYLVRLSDIDTIFLDKATLTPFKKMNFKDNNIFFDYTTQSLK